jgi:glutathionylspermidine synthase
MNKNISTAIVARKSQAKPSRKEGRSPQKSPHRKLTLFNPPQPTCEYPLTIEVLPDALQWWDETRYLLIHKDSGLRVPGSFSEKEARKIQEVGKNWDWTVDTRDRKVACGLNLLALAEIVCSQSSQEGGKE